MMPVSRRAALYSLAGLPFALRGGARDNGARVMVVCSASSGPHAEVADAIQKALSARAIAALTYHLEDEKLPRQDLKLAAGQIAVAVGMESVRALAAARTEIPILATMCFRSDLKSSGLFEAANFHLAGGVWLELTIPRIVASLREVFPNVSRVAVIRNPSKPELEDPVALSRQAAAGISVRFIDCASSSSLLPALRKLKGQSDFVVCLPDSSLYNKTTVEPIILASLEHRLPLVGFSASFVRAGAAVGVYPDYADVGRQTAALVERSLRTPGGPRDEYPRRTVTAVNERMLHLLGLRYRAKDAEIVIVR